MKTSLGYSEFEFELSLGYTHTHSDFQASLGFKAKFCMKRGDKKEKRGGVEGKRGREGGTEEVSSSNDEFHPDSIL